MTEDEALLRAIVVNPGEDTPRGAYADWLDEHDDPRGLYLRAEFEWARTGKKEKALRKLGAGLDPVWVYRVSRPPVGVCFRQSILVSDTQGPKLSLQEIQHAGERYGGFPPEYVAFLLNYNGGELLEPVDIDEWSFEGFCTINGAMSIDDVVTNIEFEYEDDGLLQDFTSLPDGRIPVAYSHCYGIGEYYSAAMLVKSKRSVKESAWRVDYYDNPLANDVPFDEASDPANCYSRIAKTFHEFVFLIDSSFQPDDTEPQ